MDVGKSGLARAALRKAAELMRGEEEERRERYVAGVTALCNRERDIALAAYDGVAAAEAIILLAETIHGASTAMVARSLNSEFRGDRGLCRHILFHHFLLWAQAVPGKPIMERVLMLELYFKYPRVLRRLRSGALGIAAHFSELGYKRGSAKVYISRLAKFSEFAARSAGGATIEQDVIDRFVQSLRTATPRIAARTAIEHARRLAPARFSMPLRHTAPDPHRPLLGAYLDHLRKCVASSPRRVTGCLWSHVGSLLGTMAMSPISLYPR